MPCGDSAEIDRRFMRRGPCKECPFSRKVPIGCTGGSDPTVYVGQIMGPFLLACHMDPDYKRDQRSTELIQCGGAAVFRSNVGVARLMPAALHTLPADAERVFASHAELLSHHLEIPLAEAEEMLKKETPDMLLKRQFAAQGAQVILMRRPNG